MSKQDEPKLFDLDGNELEIRRVVIPSLKLGEVPILPGGVTCGEVEQIEVDVARVDPKALEWWRTAPMVPTGKRILRCPMCGRPNVTGNCCCICREG